MISIDQLARIAYESYAKAQLKRHGKSGNIYPWECLQGHEQAAWIASVQAVRAELASVH